MIGAVELYGTLSLTVNLKFNVLATELNASILTPGVPPVKGPVDKPPAKTVDNCGQILVGDTLGLNDSQFGPVVFVAIALLFAPCVVELSFCSQQ